MESKLQSITKMSADINMFPKHLKDAMDEREKHKKLISIILSILFGLYISL